MTMKLNIQKWGNSAAVRLPAAILAQLGLKAGDVVDADIAGNTVTLRAAKRRYTAAELNAQCDPKAPMPDDLMEWDRMPSVGREVI